MLPNPGEGGPAASPSNEGATPVIPLPNPGEGGPVASPSDEGAIPVIPLPNPGEGGPVFTPSESGGIPIITLPNLGGGIAALLPRNARVRFFNAATDYPAFQVFINRRRAVSHLGFSSLSSYNRIVSGYQTITVAGLDGYIYLQKNLPFEAGSTSTVAIVNRAGGLDLLQISDACCPPSNGFSNFRVSNLAYQSGPIDVLLGDGRVIYADVQFKETTSFKQIQPGEYQFFFAETNLMPMPANADIEGLDSAFLDLYPIPDAVASLYLNVRRNANYTVFLVDSGSALQTIVAEDR